MNRSKQFSKWPVFVLSLLLSGMGGAALESENARAFSADDGWFNPINETADDVSTLEWSYVDEDEENAIQQVAYRRASRRGTPVRPLPPQRPRRVAMNSDDQLSWQLDEVSDFDFAQPAGKMADDANIEVLPAETAQPAPEEPAEESAPEPSGAPNPEEETGWQGDSPKKFDDLLPSFDPQSSKEKKDTKPGRAKAEQNGEKNGKLPQAGTQIDRFGNIGYLENNCASRTEDGGLAGNPYSSGVFEYQPCCFPWDPSRQTHTREFPPCESYGTDGYGNNALEGECCYGCCGFFSCLWNALFPALQHSEFSAGIYGCQAPFESFSSSNFGLDLGFNWSLPQRIFGLTWQAGGRYTRSGREESAVSDDYYRSQLFWTSGLFYHVPYGQWKFGAVYDSLRDESMWTYTVGQVRTELSCSVTECTDIGFRSASRVSDDILNFVFTDKNYTRQIKVVSNYTGFIRHTFVTGAEGTLSGGVTEDSEALIGGRLEVPVTNHSCVRNNFVYVFPKEKNKGTNLNNDTWCASVSWVVYFGGSSHGGLVNPFKPLFDVADNTTFLQKM